MSKKIKQWNSTLKADPNKGLKRTPLKRGKSQLKRTPLKRGDSQLKRTPFKSSSKPVSKRAQATSIPQEVRDIVAVRDAGKCVVEGCNKKGAPNSHYIPRSKGGLGIEENIVTHCNEHHHMMDNGIKEEREFVEKATKKYLDSLYPNFSDDDRVYKK